MMITTRTTLAVAALAALLGGAAASIPASAQQTTTTTTVIQEQVPTVTVWQSDWDQDKFDAKHIVLGTVANFTPYRITIQRGDGAQQTVDLKNGTLIYPTGATPTQGERAAMVGYYSNGTFIANRVVLRP